MGDEAEKNLRKQIKFLTDLIKNADSKQEVVDAHTSHRHQTTSQTQRATAYTARRYSNKPFRGAGRYFNPAYSAYGNHSTSAFSNQQNSGRINHFHPSRRATLSYTKSEKNDLNPAPSTKYSWRKVDVAPKLHEINSNKSYPVATKSDKNVLSSGKSHFTGLRRENTEPPGTGKDKLTSNIGTTSETSLPSTSTTVLNNLQSVSSSPSVPTVMTLKSEPVAEVSVEDVKKGVSHSVVSKQKGIEHDTGIIDKSTQLYVPQSSMEQNKAINETAVSVSTSVFNPIALRRAKTQQSFGLSETKRVHMDAKLKALSSNLKDELKKTEEQIHFLKQNLKEQKSLMTLKKNLTEPSNLLSEKRKRYKPTDNLVNLQTVEKQPSDTSQVKQMLTKSPEKSNAIEAGTHTTVPDSVYISSSPYKLVKCQSSPQKVFSNNTSEFTSSTKNTCTTQANVLQTKFKFETAVTEPVGKDQPSKLLNEDLNGTSVFKKTKYSLRRIQSAPAGKTKKTPSKFVRVSKYSIRKVRRSLSNKSNEDLGESNRQKLLSNRSRNQYASRFVRSKYKSSAWHKRQYSTAFNRYSYHTNHPKWNTNYLQSRRGRPFYTSPKLHPKVHWNNVAGHRYSQRLSLPYQQNYKDPRFHFPGYCGPSQSYGWRKSYLQTRTEYRLRLKRLQNLKRAVPFNPRLRTDHRQTKRYDYSGRNLVMINGVVYRSTQRQLVKAASSSAGTLPRHRHSIKNTPRRQSFTQRPGASVKLGGVTYLQPKPGSLVRQTSLKTRVVAAQLVNKSVAMATAKYKKDNTNLLKKKKYCLFYNRFGKCNRKEKCPFTHDPKRIAVCTRFLRGTCKVNNCPFSHKVSKEKMPVCSYFLRGKCNRDDCPYLHVNVNPDAEICEDFMDGYCPLGDECKKKHTLVCPVFSLTGSCPNGNKCKLQHRKTMKKRLAQSEKMAALRKETQDISVKVEISPSSSTDQHTVSTSSATAPSLLSSWTSILPAKNKDEPLVLDSSDEEADDSHLPFKDRKLPTFISLSVNKDDGDDVIGDDNETKKDDIRTVKIRPQL